jgi:hypothetical protein
MAQINQSYDGDHMSYDPIKTHYGLIATEIIRHRLASKPAQLDMLMQHAFCLACLDGNAFEGLIDQYLPEAYANLWANSQLDTVALPLLYPSTASDAWRAALSRDHPQYGDMDEARRAELLDQFAVDPRGNKINMESILDKATDVLGSTQKAEDWVDHYSDTLGDTPRRMSSTPEGTNEVMLHLAGISRHGHDA